MATWSRRTRFSIASLTFVATMALHFAVLALFLGQPGDPPRHGLFDGALWVHAHKELVYAYLALLGFGPLLFIAFVMMTRDRIVRLVYIGLWLAFAITLTTQASHKFSTVARVTWHHVLEAQVEKATASVPMR